MFCFLNGVRTGRGPVKKETNPILCTACTWSRIFIMSFLHWQPGTLFKIWDFKLQVRTAVVLSLEVSHCV